MKKSLIGSHTTIFVGVVLSMAVVLVAFSIAKPSREPGAQKQTTGNAAGSRPRLTPSSGCEGASFTTGAETNVDPSVRPVFVAGADFNMDGQLDLATANYVSNDVTILLSNGSGGFTQAPGSPISVGQVATCIGTGDFNLDGRIDLAVTSFSFSTVTILLGNGAGGFAEASGSPISSPGNPFFVAVSDLNLDGKPDLAVANLDGNTVTILLGNGSGGFSQPVGSPVGTGMGPQSIAIGDFNRDGKPDIATANFHNDNVTILLGNGNGAFVQPAGSPLAAGGQPASIAAGDFNGDGKIDLAVANSDTDNVTVLLGNGNGAFTQPAGSPIPAGVAPVSIAIGDFNLDGRTDLATSNLFSNNVTILSGRGDGTFIQPAGSPIGVGLSPLYVAVRDFDMDGKPDLAVANGTSNTVSILRNTCSAFPCSAISFMQPAGSPVGAGLNPSCVAVGDFNLDGKPDLATANVGLTNVTILLGNGSGGFTQPSGSPVPAGNFPISVAVGDFNRDGKPDLAVANNASGNVTILLGNGAGGFVQAAGSPIAIPGTPECVAVGDFNLDGKSDLAVADSSADRVRILLGDGSGGFIIATPIITGNVPKYVSVGDFNRDGKPDLSIANSNEGDVTVVLGNGSGGFAPAAGSPFGSIASPDCVAVGDFNLDGKLDLALTSLGSNRVLILVGNGAGSFSQAGSTISVGTSPFCVAVGDFNLDGKPDLAVSNFASSTVTILLGNGSAGFSEAGALPIGQFTQPRSVAVGDFNLDGKPDLATANFGTNDVTIELNTCGSSACSLGCPANITGSNDINQCGAVVGYPAPTGGCTAVVCSPASGSFFPVGASTVTCRSNNGTGPETCSFLVTVRDSQLPAIVCSGNVTVTAAVACPPSSSAAANFTVTAVDNCPGVTVVCKNQNNQVVTSGQQFPMGTTTVTCTATDTSNNIATCTFKVRVFSFCLEDETNPGNVVLVNAQTGDYSFCCGGVLIASGNGTLTVRGCIGSIDQTKGDRRVHIQWDTSASNGSGAGSATVQKSGSTIVCQITERRMSNNLCSCSGAQPPSPVQPQK